MTEKAQVQPYPLRLRPELREQLEAAARRAGRSLQSEITLRLESSLSGTTEQNTLQLLRLLAVEAEKEGLSITLNAIPTGQV